MNIADVEERVAAIRDLVNRVKREYPHDPERAHEAQDALYRDLLRAISRGECLHPAACAAAALEAEKIDFPRWCA